MSLVCKPWIEELPHDHNEVTRNQLSTAPGGAIHKFKKLSSVIHRGLWAVDGLARVLAHSRRQFAYLVVDRATFGNELCDLLVGVHDGCVITPPKKLAYLRQ